MFDLNNLDDKIFEIHYNQTINTPDWQMYNTENNLKNVKMEKYVQIKI